MKELSRKNRETLFTCLSARIAFDNLGCDIEREMFYESLEIKHLETKDIMEKLQSTKMYPEHYTIQFFAALAVMVRQDYKRILMNEFMQERSL